MQNRKKILILTPAAKILEAVMPEAAVELMDGAGHLPMIEKPEETATLYLQFLGSKKISPN